MSGLFSTKNFSFKFDKVKWPTFVNGPSYIARKNSPTGANTKSEKAGKYQGYVILGNLAIQELFWWIENIRLPNGRKNQLKKPQMTDRMVP